MDKIGSCTDGHRGGRLAAVLGERGVSRRRGGRLVDGRARIRVHFDKAGGPFLDAGGRRLRRGCWATGPAREGRVRCLEQTVAWPTREKAEERSVRFRTTQIRSLESVFEHIEAIVTGAVAFSASAKASASFSAFIWIASLLTSMSADHLQPLVSHQSSSLPSPKAMSSQPAASHAQIGNFTNQDDLKHLPFTAPNSYAPSQCLADLHHYILSSQSPGVHRTAPNRLTTSILHALHLHSANSQCFFLHVHRL